MDNIKPLEEYLPEFWRKMYDNLMRHKFNYDEAWKILLAYIAANPIQVPIVVPQIPAANYWNTPPNKQPVDMTPKVICRPDLDMGPPMQLREVFDPYRDDHNAIIL